METPPSQQPSSGGSNWGIGIGLSLSSIGIGKNKDRAHKCTSVQILEQCLT